MPNFLFANEQEKAVESQQRLLAALITYDTWYGSILRWLMFTMISTVDIEQQDVM